MSFGYDMYVDLYLSFYFHLILLIIITVQFIYYILELLFYKVSILTDGG